MDNIIKLPEQVLLAISLLEENGFEAYVVGGCVRDFLRGQEPQDIDLTTSARPKEMQRVFRNFRVIETGLKHGTLTVVLEGVALEITTFRVDGKYSNHRSPEEVTFTKNLYEDLKRRDFTINAMAYNPNKGIIDYFKGQEDLALGIVRCVGEPWERFDEDALRILRALRIASQLGFTIEKETKKELFSKRELLSFISSERIGQELTKILLGKEIRGVLLNYLDVLGQVLPELLVNSLWGKTVEAVGVIPEVSHLRWSALLHNVEGVDVILNRLKMDNFLKERVKILIKYQDAPLEAEAVFVKGWLNRVGVAVFMDLLELKLAFSTSRDELKEVRVVKALTQRIIKEKQCFSLKDLELSGKDLIELGIPPGERIGEVLKYVLELVIEGKEENQKVKLKEVVRKTYLKH